MMLHLYAIPFLAKLLFANGYPISSDELLGKMRDDMFLAGHNRPVRTWCDAGLLIPTRSNYPQFTQAGLKYFYGYYGPGRETTDAEMHEAFDKLTVRGDIAYTMRCCAGVIEYS